MIVHESFFCLLLAAFSIQIIESLLFSLTADRRSSIWLDKTVLQTMVKTTADAACQTLMVHTVSSLNSLKMKACLNKIFDQGIRANMRLQDLRTRMKDLQDDMREVKRQLNLEETEKKKMRFAVDPTEGHPRDYCKDELDRTTRRLGSSSDSSDGLESNQKLKLWDKLEAQSRKKDDFAQASKPKETAQASKPDFSKPNWQTTHRQPAESSYEEDNTDRDSPDVPRRTWVIFESEDEPFPLDQLSPGHEAMLENGARHRFVDIQDSDSIKEKIEKKEKMMREKDKKEVPAKQEEPAQKKYFLLQIRQKDARPPGNPFDDKGRIIRTLD